MKHILTFLILTLSVSIYGQKEINSNLTVKGQLKVETVSELTLRPVETTKVAVFDTGNVVHYITIEELLNLGTKPEPTNGNTFTGALALDNIFGTYHTEYDLSASGSLTFNISQTPQINASHIVKIISDGVTPLASESEISKFIYTGGLPDNRILASGEYEVFFYHTNNGTSFTINPLLAVSNETLPYFEDAVVYVNSTLDTPTLENTNQVSEMTNRVDNTNNYSQTNNALRPTWDNVNKWMTFNSAEGDRLNLASDEIINSGTWSFVFVGNIPDGGSSSEFMLHQNPSGGSLRTFGFQDRGGRDMYLENIYPNGSSQVDSNSGRVTNAYRGNVIILVVIDTPNGSAKIHTRNDNYAATITKTPTVQAATTAPINMLESRIDTTLWNLQSIAVWNKVFTDLEATEILDYFDAQLNP
jgi:hypothetical protein